MMKQFLSILGLIMLISGYTNSARADYTFAAPPRESREKGIEIYKPIADFLSKQIGETFIYRHPGNWTEYSRAMQNEEYDLVFDGPHFVSWRIKNINHDVAIKLPQLHIWRVIVRSDNNNVNSMDDLVGRKICAPKSPNFGMLTMMSHYPNPDREPIHIVTKGWKDGFNAVVEGKCEATVLPKTNHRKFDPDFIQTRAIHTHLPYPNQAFTYGPRMSSELKSNVKNALLSRDGQESMKKLRERFTRGANLVSAENEEYEGISLVLKRAKNFLSAK